MKYLKLKLDLSKRHFVFGDIHGKFDEMIELLESVNYNMTKDYVYCVGDMIDRGDQNLAVVDFFLNNENAYSCMGNHENMVVDPSYHKTWLANGGYQTLLELLEDKGLDYFDTNQLEDHDLALKDFMKSLENLPYVIDVGDENDEQRFRIMHAEFPLDHTEELIQMELLEEDPTFMANILWSRKDINWIIKLNNIGNIKEIQKMSKYLKNRQTIKTYSGHTPIPQYLTFGNRCYIDTGAYGKLTMVEALTNTYHTL